MLALHTYGPRSRGATLSGYNIYPAEVGLTQAQRQASLATGLPLCWGHEMDTLHASAAPLGAEDSARTALYGAYLGGVPALYWETTWSAGGHEEYGAALLRLLAHCELLVDADDLLPPPPPRVFHESLGHGAGLMSSHNQFPCEGLWLPAKAVWDTIDEGEVLGTIRGLYGEERGEVLAAKAGTVLSLIPMQHVSAGAAAGMIL
jgi:hypothetical protein